MDDTTILNALQQLVDESNLPFDVAFGQVFMTIRPRLPLRPQLIEMIEKHVPRLVADKFTSR